MPDAGRPPPCASNADCPPDGVCLDGLCFTRQCVVREDCPDPAHQFCDDRFQCLPDPEDCLCTSCNSDQDCPLGEFCSVQRCLSTAGRTSCTRSAQCGIDERCDRRVGLCVADLGGCDHCPSYPELCCEDGEWCDAETRRCIRVQADGG